MNIRRRREIMGERRARFEKPESKMGNRPEADTNRPSESRSYENKSESFYPEEREIEEEESERKEYAFLENRHEGKEINQKLHKCILTEWYNGENNKSKISRKCRCSRTTVYAVLENCKENESSLVCEQCGHSFESPEDTVKEEDGSLVCSECGWEIE